MTGRLRHEQTIFNYLGSTKMYAMNEALARDRMREHERRSRQGRLTRELSSERRWHRPRQIQAPRRAGRAR